MIGELYMSLAKSVYIEVIKKIRYIKKQKIINKPCSEVYKKINEL